MGRQILAAGVIGAVVAGSSGPAWAQSFRYQGDTRGAPVFQRPDISFGSHLPFALRTAYEARAIHVDRTGRYHILSDQTNFGLLWDGVLLVYEFEFDSAQPLEWGYVASDDYFGSLLPGFGIGYSGAEDVYLEADVTYWVVQTGFADGDAGPYEISIIGAGAVAFGPGTPPAPGEVWSEDDDAGALPQTAQTPGLDSTPLRRIRGQLESEGDADMYRLRIDEPSIVELATDGMTSVDTQLWLLDVTGAGVSHNDDAGFFSFGSRITDQFVAAPGEYLLAVSEWDTDALSSEGEDIWADEPFHIERRPDGTAPTEPVGHWLAEGFFGGAYSIRISGARAGCHGDYDGDGSLTFFDFLSFQNDYAFGVLRADCTGDGALDFFDFLCIQNAFAAGCP